MFKVLGVLVLLYVGYAVSTGEIYAKAGWRYRYVSRADSAGYFWVVVVCYVILAAMLLTVF